MSFEPTIMTIKKILATEQQSMPVKTIDDVRAHQAQRHALRKDLYALEQELRALREQAKNLPALPPLAVIQWARSVRAMPNLVFLEVDTTGLHQDAEIIRVVLLDPQSTVLFDGCTLPSQPLPESITRITGVSQTHLQSYGVALSTLLTQLRAALRGTYLLSYNLDFDRQHLANATKRVEVEDIPIIGEDLMQRAMQYFSLTSYPKLETLCEQIGHELPTHPNQTALDRARGQIVLLNAIADVTMGTVQDDDDDEHPF